MQNPDDQIHITHYHIPDIEVYHVMDYELLRIEEGCGQVGQDLTFCVAALSVGVSFGIALATATLSALIRDIFIVVIFFSGACSLYTGIKWLRTRRITPDTIASIRRRRVAPEPPSQHPAA